MIDHNQTHSREVMYFKAPPDWDENQLNPFADNGTYGPEWSVFRLRDEDDDNIINGRPGGEAYEVPVPENADKAVEARRSIGPYCYVMGRGILNTEARFTALIKAEMFRGHKVAMALPSDVDTGDFIGHCAMSIETMLADFLRYETAHGRKVIISSPPDIDTDALVKRALANVPDRTSVRPEDARWWVHSTPLENWENIKACGELRSIARLHREGVSLPGVGLFAFGEPEDYADYVMLALTVVIGPEHVVSSQQKGYLITEEDTPYQPGVRLYFDGHRIIKDGLAVSDGLHTLKVYDHLPLNPYLVAAVSIKEVDPNGEIGIWTPWTFLNSANQYFKERFICED